MAAERGHKYTVGCLIHRGADFNIEDNAGVSTYMQDYSAHSGLSLLICCVFLFNS